MSSQLEFSSRGNFSDKTSATLGCLPTFSSRHVLNLRDNGLKSPSKQPRQEGETTKGCAKWPSIGEWPTVEGAIDIEQIVVTQGKQIT